MTSCFCVVFHFSFSSGSVLSGRSNFQTCVPSHTPVSTHTTCMCNLVLPCLLHKSLSLPLPPLPPSLPLFSDSDVLCACADALSSLAHDAEARRQVHLGPHTYIHTYIRMKPCAHMYWCTHHRSTTAHNVHTNYIRVCSILVWHTVLCRMYLPLAYLYSLPSVGVWPSSSPSCPTPAETSSGVPVTHWPSVPETTKWPLLLFSLGATTTLIWCTVYTAPHFWSVQCGVVRCGVVWCGV